ncbi:MAG: hypothetical protein GPOALKHO_000080 [Sodalis sp.]|nr:MAG: hypothetical protein GPOALKHO_000080 [Sodalis sp.]
MIVTQKEIGEDIAHRDRLDTRTMLSIEESRVSLFSVVSAGAYTFAYWKVAISDFYKLFNFIKVVPMNGKP